MSEEFAEGTAGGGLTDDGASTGQKQSVAKSQKVSISGDSDEDDFSYENKKLHLLALSGGYSKLS